MLQRAPMPPLLVASLSLAFLGYVWVVGILLWNYPWLVQLLFFISVAVALFGGSLLCLVFYLVRLKHEQGAMQLLPPSAADVLDLSIFEIVEVLNRVIMRPFYDFIRVLLLINADLDEKTRKEILEEMSPEFRRRVFQCSVVSLLPGFLQKLALGKDFTASTDNKATMQDLFGYGDKTAIGVGDESPVRRHRSLTDLLEFMRSVEGSSEKSRQSTVLQKILASKVSDAALCAMSQGAVHQYESHLSNRVHYLLDIISKEPERRVLKLPWRVLHWEVTMAHSVLKGAASWFFEKTEQESADAAKKDS
ncbi:unnamed protein product [Cladocopium goreaui]|uniref:Uncharacterized protein n=1 Tax=Cladocopium goreaui TaxID=2562237 RepID=A0A9P1C8J5_9DINO|nr:unnamed protein product [Cladocopium goreaui]